ncbi:MAG TPA: FtsQ-type POTRA domain-containing protein [Candidatus Caenarcaniphilales bacterium]|nr:FtsQ-type POTRA domain-containing protein [Candidatus Caenarcaniphilales bacterium]
MTDPTRFQLEGQGPEISGLVHTEPALVLERIGLPAGSRANLFSLRTAEMERRLQQLPAVAQAEVRAVLPDSLFVTVTERVPVFVWRVDGRDLLVDSTGILVSEVVSTAPSAVSLPVVTDRRPAAAGPPAVGSTLDPVDLAVMLRLAGVTPELLGSSAGRLELSVEPNEGYVLTTVPPSWRAVFGQYTPTLRTPDLIDQQVQCLRSLLAQGEAAISTVHLAVADDRCGTYRPRATAGEGASPTPEP